MVEHDLVLYGHARQEHDPVERRFLQLCIPKDDERCPRHDVVRLAAIGDRPRGHRPMAIKGGLIDMQLGERVGDCNVDRGCGADVVGGEDAASASVQILARA